MGHKKRNPTPRSKPSSPAAENQVAHASSDSTTDSFIASTPAVVPKSTPVFCESDSPNYPAIKAECERALTSLRRGNHTKALRLMKDASHRYENSALIHRVQGTICVKMAAIMDDQNAKTRHLRNAIDSARKAVDLSPNSLEFSHFYANLLYEAATEQSEYDEVVRECQRVLDLPDPIDPGRESLQDENQQKISTAEARIMNMKQELRSLVQKANISSISNWMKTLGTGEEKFRLIPIRRISEDPMEVRLVQTVRRPNEIRKATKTPEERRKEIEVRVAAARLLQQKSESSPAEDSTKGTELNSPSAAGSGHKSAERRRHGSSRRNVSSAERKDQVTNYWNSLSYEMKRGLLSVRVSDVRARHKDGLAAEVLSEALSFAEANKSWRFWTCCQCGEKFADADSHLQHVSQQHMGSLLPNLKSVLPPIVDSEWAEMLLCCSWKPLDLDAAVKMLETHSKPVHSVHAEKNHKEDSRWNDSSCPEHGWESFSDVKSLVDGCNNGPLERREENKGFDAGCRVCHVPQDSEVYDLRNGWPLSDDAECAKLLDKVGSTFQVLAKQKCLAASHIQKVIRFAMDELRGLAPGSQLLNCGIDQTPLCICFLGVNQLKKIVKFLQEMSHACGLGRYPEKMSSDEVSSQPQVSEIEEKVLLNEDASCILLDENLLPADADGEDSGSDSLLSWMYAGPSTVEQLSRWSRIREEKAQQGTDILQVLSKDFGNLHGLCERKYENLGYEEALQGLEELCVEENNKREQANEFVRGSYQSALKNRRDEIIEGGNEVMFGGSRFELEAIDMILKEADNLNLTQLSYEESYGSMSSHLCDLEAGVDSWKSKDYLHQVDTCIEVAIQRQKEQLSIEISRLDARTLRTLASMQQLELKLDPASSLDYRSIVLPLVKSFMRAHLEDLAEKDATEKSDAAREAFLAELALDSKRSNVAGGDNSRSLQEKMKDRKKNKDSRKTKDSKPSSLSEQLGAATTSDGEHEEAEVVDPERTGDLIELDDEFRIKIELEAEERKLEETLEYQRRVENEAKQKHLAEQRKRNGQAASDDVADIWTDASFQPESSAEALLAPKNGFANGLEGVDSVLTDDCALVGGQQVQMSQDKQPPGDKRGLSNGVQANGVLPFDQRNARKGRRRSSGRPQEARYQAVSSVKENLVGNTPHDADNGEGGLKTLRQLQAEEADDERFQADLEQAVRQSLDSYQARLKHPFVQAPRTGQKIPEALDNSIASSSEETTDNVNGLDVYGTGLQNEVGEYNCFLNVIIQSLWHLRRFRVEFLSRPTPEHFHVGDPCVVCSLYDILTALNTASVDTKREPVAPTSLRIALSHLYPDSNFFQEGQMNDASEVLAVIFQCLHKSFTPQAGSSDSESVESNCLGSWDCSRSGCIAHSLFGMDIFERMNCYNCGLESRHLKYTSFFHNINASALRTTKEMCVESSFDELLNLVEMNHQLACDPEAGGCGKLNHIHHILSTPPHVFTTVLGWQNTCESINDITATLAALSTEIDISVLYRGLDPKNMRRLVSVVCYYGQHYHCFAYSHDQERWIMYDDKTVKVIGTWEDVLTMCEKGHLQPQVLFYEAVN